MDTMQYTHLYRSPLGTITLAADSEGLTGLWFEGQKYFAATLDAQHEETMLPIFEQTRRWLDNYFGGNDPGPTPPLHLQGSPFRLAVWEILRQIPFGKTITYGEIAREIARRQGPKTVPAQAVGGAVGHNPVGIIVPCHRVVGSNGSLTGYAGGIERKVRLLALEKADMTGLFAPQKAQPCKSRNGRSTFVSSCLTVPFPLWDSAANEQQARVPMPNRNAEDVEGPTFRRGFMNRQETAEDRHAVQNQTVRHYQTHHRQIQTRGRGNEPRTACARHRLL